MKFKSFLNSFVKWITIIWNMFSVFIMGVYSIVALSYSAYTIEGYAPSILNYIGITIFINAMNLWIRHMIVTNTKK